MLTFFTIMYVRRNYRAIRDAVVQSWPARQLKALAPRAFDEPSDG